MKKNWTNFKFLSFLNSSEISKLTQNLRRDIVYRRRKCAKTHPAEVNAITHQQEGVETVGAGGLQNLGSVCTLTCVFPHKTCQGYTKTISQNPELCWLRWRPEEGNCSHTVGTGNSYRSFPSSSTQNTVCARKSNSTGLSWWSLTSANRQ